MTLVGEIFFGNEKIDFLFVMGVFGRKNVYVKNKGKKFWTVRKQSRIYLNL